MIKISKKNKIIIGGMIACILIGSSIVGYKQYQYNTGYRLSTAERKTNIEEQLKQGNYDKAKSLANNYRIDVNEIDDIINLYKDSNDRTSLELFSVEKTLEEKKSQEAKEAEEKKLKEAAEKKAKEEQEKKLKKEAESRANEVEKNNTVKTESTSGVVLMNKSNIKVICTGVAGSNYNYIVKITIENNTSNDISTVFNELNINNMELTGNSMISGIVKKGTKQDFNINTGIMGILTGYFTVADSTGHNITISAEELTVNLNQVPKLN